MTRRYDIDRIRNIGIIAHVDAGKTTLTERVLYYTGRIHAPGEVHLGTTRTDSHPLEQTKGITILAAAVTCDWQDHRIHLIDTPGHVDFTIEVERSLRVLDGAVVVLDGVAGVEPQTETVWRQADRHRVPRIVFVNKLDRVGADYARALGEVATRLGARPIAVSWPLYDGDQLVGVTDLVGRQQVRWRSEGPSKPEFIPVELSDNLISYRERLLEAAADHDPDVLETIVAGRDVDAAALWRGLRAATVRGAIVLVLAGSAYRYRGVEPLLDAIVALLPSPRDRGAVEGREPSPSAPLAALGFKVVFDRHGQLTFVRVYSGVLAGGDTVVSSRSGKRLRVGRLVQLVGEQRIEVDRLQAGELGAILGMPLSNGETISAPDAPVVLESIVAPDPVVRVAIEAKTSADRERLGVALGRMVAADPSLHIETDDDTGQTLLAGMGQLHLDIAVQRLALEHGVEVARASRWSPTARPCDAWCGASCATSSNRVAPANGHTSCSRWDQRLAGRASFSKTGSAAARSRASTCGACKPACAKRSSMACSGAIPSSTCASLYSMARRTRTTRASSHFTSRVHSRSALQRRTPSHVSSSRS